MKFYSLVALTLVMASGLYAAKLTVENNLENPIKNVRIYSGDAQQATPLVDLIVAGETSTPSTDFTTGEYVVEADYSAADEQGSHPIRIYTTVGSQPEATVAFNFDPLYPVIRNDSSDETIVALYSDEESDADIKGFKAQAFDAVSVPKQDADYLSIPAIGAYKLLQMYGDGTSRLTTIDIPSEFSSIIIDADHNVSATAVKTGN